MLKDVAKRSIRHGVRTGQPLPVDPAMFPAELREKRACFVTLRRAGKLRGCIGALEPDLPLVVGVSENSFKAGFRDPRFPPLGVDELPDIELQIAVLTPLEHVPAASEEDLIATLRPGVDGVVLRQGSRQATFLPAVWQELPDPAQFLRQLKRKAGLAVDGWPDAIEVCRYTTESVD
jgi:AmmeMemoRadiSam system protein A